MKAVALLGTAHSFQRGAPSCSEKDEYLFVDVIIQICRQIGAAAIAEEMSAELIEAEPRRESTCLTAAQQLGITHRYCDPSPENRRSLSVRDVQSIWIDAWLNRWSEERERNEMSVAFEKREQFWLDQLHKLDTWPVLFVCGANHVLTFSQLLSKAAIGVSVISQDWTPNTSFQRTALSGRG